MKEASVFSSVPGPLPFPKETRRIVVRVVGPLHDAALLLRGEDGEEREVSLARSGEHTWAASVPAGCRFLSAIRITPRKGAYVHLARLEAEVASSSGVFAEARSEDGFLAVRVYNLGSRVERVSVHTGSEAPLVESDLAPGGRAVMRVPFTVLTGGAFPRSVSIRWNGGEHAVPVR